MREELLLDTESHPGVLLQRHARDPLAVQTGAAWLPGCAGKYGIAHEQRRHDIAVPHEFPDDGVRGARGESEIPGRHRRRLDDRKSRSVCRGWRDAALPRL